MILFMILFLEQISAKQFENCSRREEEKSGEEENNHQKNGRMPFH